MKPYHALAQGQFLFYLSTPRTFPPKIQFWPTFAFFVPRYQLRISTGILTCFPSTTPFGLALGPDSPSMDEPSGGTLRFSGHWILTNVCVTQADILTSALSTLTFVYASPQSGTLPYRFLISKFYFCLKIPQLRQTAQSHSFSAQERSTSELLRTLLRVAASKQTSWLFQHSYLLYHLAAIQGPQLVIWAVSLSTMKLIPHRLTG